MNTLPSAPHVKIPKQWISKKLSYLVSLQSGEMINGEAIKESGTYPVYGGGGFRGFTEAFTHQGNHVLIGRQGALCGNVTYAEGPLWATEHSIVATPCEVLVPKWLAAQLDSMRLGQYSTSAAQPGIAAEVISGLKVLVPPLTTQRSIAAYLDRETARLDEMVRAKEGLLGLVAEKRRALITRAVTRGLNSKAPLRDSGQPWLGLIPQHWETRRLAFLFADRDHRGESELPLLEVSINKGVVLREFSDDKIESTAADFNSYKVARKGDIVFNKMRMWQGAVGVAPIDGLTSPDYTVAIPTGELEAAYAGQLFRTGIFSAECCRHSNGITWDRLRLYWEGFRDIWVPLPPLAEQRAIVTHIATETTKLDKLRASAERSIALLKERRAALIAAAVTGKIAIPELSA